MKNDFYPFLMQKQKDDQKYDVYNTSARRSDIKEISHLPFYCMWEQASYRKQKFPIHANGNPHNP